MWKAYGRKSRRSDRAEYDGDILWAFYAHPRSKKTDDMVQHILSLPFNETHFHSAWTVLSTLFTLIVAQWVTLVKLQKLFDLSKLKLS